MPARVDEKGHHPAMSDGGDAGVRGLDEDAFQALLATNAPSLYRFARSLGANPASAEDLVQDTFLRALERRSQYHGGNAGAWLRRILHNLAIDRSRTAAAGEIPVAAVEQRWSESSYTVDAAVVVERAQLRDELEDALVRLPFIYRAAVVLHDVEGWTVRATAEATGVSLPAAKQRLRRGRMMLVTALAAGAERRSALEGVPMSCWDARLLVSDYMSDELAPDDRRRVEAHLAHCPTCPPLYAALVGVRAELGRLRDPDSVIPPGVAERLSAAVAAFRPG
jgi:RNA polymerase sigma-70 factor, ECF subfamily